MATFSYEALTSVGQEVKAEVEATSRDDAEAKIRGMGYFPTQIRRKSAYSGRRVRPSTKHLADNKPRRCQHGDCQHENKPGSEFCAQCGRPMAVGPARRAPWNRIAVLLPIIVAIAIAVLIIKLLVL